MSYKTELTFKYLKKMAGAELRQARESRGLSVEEAASLAGLNYANIIHGLEAGNSSHLFAFFRLVDVYGKKIEIKLVG